MLTVTPGCSNVHTVFAGRNEPVTVGCGTCCGTHEVLIEHFMHTLPLRAPGGER